MASIDVGFKIFGGDFIAEIEFDITAPYIQATYDNPSEGPEFEIYSIDLYEDVPNFDKERMEGRSKPVECPRWLVDLIAESDAISEKISEYSWENDDCGED